MGETRCLERDVYPWFGDREAKSVEAPEIIPIIMKVSDCGAIDAAKRVKVFIQQVFDYAVVHGKAPRNPIKDINLQLILPKQVKNHFSAITDPEEFGNLLRAIDEVHEPEIVGLYKETKFLLMGHINLYETRKE